MKVLVLTFSQFQLKPSFGFWKLGVINWSLRCSPFNNKQNLTANRNCSFVMSPKEFWCYLRIIPIINSTNQLIYTFYFFLQKSEEYWYTVTLFQLIYQLSNRLVTRAAIFFHFWVDDWFSHIIWSHKHSKLLNNRQDQRKMLFSPFSFFSVKEDRWSGAICWRFCLWIRESRIKNEYCPVLSDLL